MVYFEGRDRMLAQSLRRAYFFEEAPRVSPACMQKLFYPLLGLLFVLSTLLSLAFGSLDVSLLREGGAFLVMVVLPFWVYHRRRFKTLADHVFFWASVLTITHSFLNGITYLADTPVPGS